MDLWITADDYGLSRGINRAIEKLAAERRISGVSVMAHEGAELDSLARLVATCNGNDVAIGLHLCFTGGDRMPRDHRRLAAALLARPSRLEELAAEADAQASRLASAGATLAFVNAHEHVHLLPPIWPMVARLVRRIDAASVRIALGQRMRASAQGAVVAASRLSWALSPLRDTRVLSPLGVGLAGALTLPAIEALLDAPFARAPNRMRELCVHPADDESGRSAELALLSSDAFSTMLDRRGLRMARARR